MRVRALYVYPVKACRALARDELTLTALGADQDRRFAFAAEDGSALTQRDQPLLATVVPALRADELREWLRTMGKQPSLPAATRRSLEAALDGIAAQRLGTEKAAAARAKQEEAAKVRADELAAKKAQEKAEAKAARRAKRGGAG